MAILTGVARRILDRRLGPGRTALGGAPGGDADAAEAARLLAGEVDALREEVAGLRREMDEAQNRMDFAERLLAQARERGLLNPPKGVAS